MKSTSVLKSDFLTSDSLIPTFVFSRGRQSKRCRESGSDMFCTKHLSKFTVLSDGSLTNGLLL